MTWRGLPSHQGQQEDGTEALLWPPGVAHRPELDAGDLPRRFGVSRPIASRLKRMRASSRNPALRLLCMGVALVLRNVWVWLHAEVMAQPQRGARHLRPQSIRFARLLM